MRRKQFLHILDCVAAGAIVVMMGGIMATMCFRDAHAIFVCYAISGGALLTALLAITWHAIISPR